MKNNICIEKSGTEKIIMQNPYGTHKYFGWPTVAKLKNGKISVVASGFRLRHLCPFGKAVISFSDDNGESYTFPAPVIDTPLDDRDAGILPFGKKGVIITSFNNTADLQRNNIEFYGSPELDSVQKQAVEKYGLAYLDTITVEDEKSFLGSTFRISNDNGVTFGPVFHSPVSSPHGPAELSDGSIVWVGTVFRKNEKQEPGMEVHKINLDGTTEYIGKIKAAKMNGFDPFSCEPHAVEAADGTLITQFRVQKVSKMVGFNDIFTIFQSESRDSGKTWSEPHQILPILGGSPPHLLRHSSGMLICSYCYRENPYCIRVMFSKDNGITWDNNPDYNIYVGNISDDMGYPATVELDDGSLLTVFYAHPAKGDAAVIMQQKWRFSIT